MVLCHHCDSRVSTNLEHHSKSMDVQASSLATLSTGWFHPLPTSALCHQANSQTLPEKIEVAIFWHTRSSNGLLTDTCNCTVIALVVGASFHPSANALLDTTQALDMLYWILVLLLSGDHAYPGDVVLSCISFNILSPHVLDMALLFFGFECIQHISCKHRLEALFHLLFLRNMHYWTCLLCQVFCATTLTPSFCHLGRVVSRIKSKTACPLCLVACLEEFQTAHRCFRECISRFQRLCLVQ